MTYSKLVGRSGKAWLVALSAVFIFFPRASAAGQTAGACPADLTGYRVAAIKVHTSFGFTKAAKKRIDDAVNAAAGGLKVNEMFTSTARDHTLRAVQRMAAPKRGAARVSGPVVLPLLVFTKVKACDAAAQTLEAHFYAYSADYQTYVSSLFGAEQDDLNRAAPATPLTQFIASTNPQPFVGFNRSRGVFGGGSFRASFDNPAVNEIEAGATGSASSAEAGAGFQGSRDSGHALMAHAEWKAGYGYSNVPSTTNDLREGAAYGQFIGATRPAGKLGFVARYGAAFEAGNKQTDLDPRLLPPDILTSSRYNSLKVFAGGLFQTGSHSFDLSYGVEAGNAKAGLSVDYLKQVLDTGYSNKFFPAKRRPVTIDARLTAGTLDRRGAVPLAARFFGGNVEENFISSPDWVIREAPFIRSFPENRFLPAGQTFATGGDKFASFNLTAAATVWGYPLVPDEVSGSSSFDTALDAQLTLAEIVLTEQFFIEQAAPLRDFAKNTLKLTPVIDSLRETLRGLAGTFPAGSDAELIYMDAVEDACWAGFSLNEVALAIEDPSAVKKVCDKDSLGDGRTLVWLDSLLLSNRVEPNPPVRSGLHNLSCDLLLLADELKGAGAPADKIAAVEEAGRQVEAVRKTACAYACLKTSTTEPARHDVGVDLASCASDAAGGTGPLCPGPCSGYVSAQDEAATSSARVEARHRAREMAEYSGKVVRRLVKDENLIAFGPVFMFDAARIAERSQSLGDAPTRYGVGVGGRLTLVSMDMTFGYSFNPNRRANEPRGAFVFSLNVSDLLK